MRYLMTFSYDGSDFCGYQKQNNKRSVQTEIEKTLNVITKKTIKIHASGRTDAKVHAQNQYAHFDMEINITVDKLKKALNSLLEKDIYIKKIIEVEPNFHARFDVEKKEYIYLINTKEFNVFERNHVFQYNRKLDVKKMQEASKYLLGKHDFRAFSKSDASKEDMVREIYNIEIIEGDLFSISFIGNGFLRYMIRNMVGSLIEVGSGLKEPEYIKEILASKNRKNAGITAKPEGLYLKDVIYRKKIDKNVNF